MRTSLRRSSKRLEGETGLLWSAGVACFASSNLDVACNSRWVFGGMMQDVVWCMHGKLRCVYQYTLQKRTSGTKTQHTADVIRGQGVPRPPQVGSHVRHGKKILYKLFTTKLSTRGPNISILVPHYRSKGISPGLSGHGQKPSSSRLYYLTTLLTAVLRDRQKY